YVRHRDQWCRTPWCNAPIRHGDHITDWADTGTTDATDAQGLCESCNHAKQAVGWHARPSPRPGDQPGHTVETTTPTGHTYTSNAPPVVGLRRGAYQQQWEGHWTRVS
ncbi:MAG TPA: HNH endonuclease signature motif containing protein, partial [Marmoricola sp.]